MSVYVTLDRQIARRDLRLAEALIDPLINVTGGALGARAIDAGLEVRRWIRFVRVVELDEELNGIAHRDRVGERERVRQRAGVLTPLSEDEERRLYRGNGRLIRFNQKELRVVLEDLAAIETALERAARLLPKRQDEIGRARRGVATLARLAAR